jgi:predicted alpha/beta superfamily hydrolase
MLMPNLKSSLLFFFILLHSLPDGFSQSNSPKPFLLVEIQEIQSVILNEKRTLNIYLPQDYDENDTTRYAVIYLLDGSADEDFIHIAGLIQFNSFPWINRVPKSIVVGIANVDRQRDFTFPTRVEADKTKFPTTGHSERFTQFLVELQSFIDMKYRSNGSKTIIGQSLGGLLAAEILLKHPTLFDTYIIVSPSLWWDNGSLLNQTGDILKENYPSLTKVYIGVGKEGLTPSDPPRVMEDDAKSLAEKLKGSKSDKVRVYFDYLPDEDHATILHQAVNNAFIKLYKQ